VDAFGGQGARRLVQTLDASRARAQRDVSAAVQRQVDDATRARVRARVRQLNRHVVCESLTGRGQSL